MERGVGPEDVVAVAVARSVELIVALLGIVKAGAAYLPLDQDYPLERTALMLMNAEPACVLSMKQTASQLPMSSSQIILDAPETIAVLAQTTARNPLDGDRRSPLTVSNPAYIIYTSGSTGTPKGVVVSHGAIVNRLLWMQEAYALEPDDRILQKTPSSFDGSVWEFFWPLLEGAML